MDKWSKIGAVIDGTLPGRTNENQITLYKSLGTSVQDLASAQWLYQRALEQVSGWKWISDEARQLADGPG